MTSLIGLAGMGDADVDSQTVHGDLAILLTRHNDIGAAGSRDGHRVNLGVRGLAPQRRSEVDGNLRGIGAAEIADDDGVPRRPVRGCRYARRRGRGWRHPAPSAPSGCHSPRCR